MNANSALAPLENIPADEVGKVVQDFVTYNKATKVIVTRQPDGKYTVEPYKN
jgi:hypothetical protein